MSTTLRLPVATTLLFALAITPAVRSDETAAADTEPLHANIGNIEDMRSATGGGCQIMVTFFGDDLDNVAAVLRTRITRADDDLGRSLVVAENESTNPPRLPFHFHSGAHRSPIMATLLLQNPSRRATVIKTIEGTVDLCRPTEANGGVITLPSPLAQPGVPLKNAALEKQGIQVIYLTEKQAAGKLHDSGEDRRLEAVAAEVARRRMLREHAAEALSPSPNPRTTSGAPSSSTIPPSSAELHTIDSKSPAVAPAPFEQYRTTFEIIDPKNRLLELQWRDAKGAPVGPAGALQPYFTHLRVLVSTEQPQPDWQLVALVASPESVISRPFHLENVALP